jgi:hypothetical protein
MPFLLVLTGLTAAAIGTWRSYGAARLALAPLVHLGEPTRTSLDAERPVHERSRVRLFARRVVLALAWLVVGFYGLFLVSVGVVGR